MKRLLLVSGARRHARCAYPSSSDRRPGRNHGGHADCEARNIEIRCAPLSPAVSKMLDDFKPIISSAKVIAALSQFNTLLSQRVYAREFCSVMREDMWKVEKIAAGK